MDIGCLRLLFIVRWLTWSNKGPCNYNSAQFVIVSEMRFEPTTLTFKYNTDLLCREAWLIKWSTGRWTRRRWEEQNNNFDKVHSGKTSERWQTDSFEAGPANKANDFFQLAQGSWLFFGKHDLVLFERPKVVPLRVFRWNRIRRKSDVSSLTLVTFLNG